MFQFLWEGLRASFPYGSVHHPKVVGFVQSVTTAPTRESAAWKSSKQHKEVSSNLRGTARGCASLQRSVFLKSVIKK